MAKFPLKPAEGVIIVEQVEQPEKTAGGIIVEREKKVKGRAKVMALDPKIMQVKVGDIVLYKEFAGTEAEVEGKTYLFLNEDDLMAVI